MRPRSSAVAGTAYSGQKSLHAVRVRCSVWLGLTSLRPGCASAFIHRDVLARFLDAEDMRTSIECLFGDAAARTLGFTSQGLSPWAGLAMALHDARPNS
jgi:hypothetical protein